MRYIYMSQDNAYTAGFDHDVLRIRNVTTEQITLSGKSITDVATTVNKQNKDNNILVSKAAMAQYCTEAINELATETNANQHMTDSLVGRYFDFPDHFRLTGWNIVSGIAIYTGDVENAFKVAANQYMGPGTYLAEIQVQAVNSGKLSVYIADERKYEIKDAGFYYVPFAVTDTSNAIKLVAEEVAAQATIEVSKFGLYKVSNALNAYMENLVKQLSTVDASEFVTLVKFDDTLAALKVNFDKELIDRDAELLKHTSAKNPHGITPEMIGASPASHEHDNYTTPGQVTDYIDKALAGYSKSDHTHSEYINADEAIDIIGKLVTASINKFISVKNDVITSGPEGILPARMNQTDMNKQLVILVPTTVANASGTHFDACYGMVTINTEALKDQAYDFFSADQDRALMIGNDIQKPVNVRMDFHRSRKLSGYRLTCCGMSDAGVDLNPVDAIVSSWKVISGNTTFIHQITDPNVFHDDMIGDLKQHVAEIVFDEPIDFKSISFMLDEWTILGDCSLWVRVDLITCDVNENSFGITEQPFTFTVPDQGANILISKSKTDTITSMKPEKQIQGLPLHVFMEYIPANENMNINGSYYPPEYSNVRKGILIYTSAYEDIDISIDELAYVHPAYGKLSLLEGTMDAQYPLKNIYSEEEQGFATQEPTRDVVIEQTVTNTKVLLCGYTLAWRLEETEHMPDGWTLTIIGRDPSTNEQRQVVYDSVEKFYPFYSVEDDDIVYHASFDTPIYVDKIRLSMKSEDAKIIRLNKVDFYMSERWYNINANVWYKGIEPVSEIEIGTATYVDEHMGYKVHNKYVGNSCKIPANDLEPVRPYSPVQVPNPFGTKEVSVSVNMYEFMSPSIASIRQVYITNVSDGVIEIQSNSDVVVGLDVTRKF